MPDDRQLDAEVENMEPSGDELDRLVDQHPAPSEWSEEWKNWEGMYLWIPDNHQPKKDDDEQ